jgi:hypothetical protein
MTDLNPVVTFAALAVLVLAFFLVHREHSPKKKRP